MPDAPSFHPFLVQALRNHAKQARKLMEGKEDPEQVHIVRTGIKRMRASWRLLRPALPDADFLRENRTLKNASLKLGPLREAHVLRKTIRKLAEKNGKWDFPGDADVRKEIDTRLAVEGRKEILENAFAVLSASLERFAGLDPERWDYGRLRDLLGTSYQKAGKAGRDPEAAGAGGFHDWRKRVKDHGYQLEGLLPMLSGPISDTLKGLDDLQNILGEENDLRALEHYFRAHAAFFTDEKILTEISKTIGRELGRLRKKSLRIGKPLFKRKPERYLKRLLSGGPPGRLRLRPAA